MPMPQVLVAGGVNMDTTYRVARLPKVGETVNSIGKSQAIGGKGLNQAVAVRRAGTPVGIVGSIGDDIDGQAIRQFLQAEGIHCELLATHSNASTGQAIILVDDSAENLIVVDLGANLETDAAVVATIGAAWSAIRAVVANGETPQDVAVALFRSARERSITTVWNPSPMPAEVATLLQLTDTLLVNQTEAAHLAGGDASTIELGQSCLRAGPSEVVITLGGDGCQVCTPLESTKLPSHEVDAIDPTAAGDTFLGCYVSSRLKGYDPAKAAHIANAAAALCVQNVGASDAIPLRDDLPSEDYQSA